MRSDTEFANSILTKNLLGACVESFGLTHQFLTLTFRDDKADDHTIWIDTEVKSNCQDFDCLPIDDTAKALLLFNKVNLKSVIAISCNDESTLEIVFDAGVVIILSGIPVDTTAIEPWTIGKNPEENSYGVIAMHGGGYTVFGGSPEII